MDGPELLKALMVAAGENAYAVATSLKKPALQSYIWKFTNGKAKEPRRASLQPLADRYGIPVEAFYDSGIAEEIAVARGLLPGSPASGVPAAPQAARPRPDEFTSALEVIAKALVEVDMDTRESVAQWLSKLALDPSKLGITAQRLRALLGNTPGESLSPDDSRSMRRFAVDTGGWKHDGTSNRDASSTPPRRKAK